MKAGYTIIHDDYINESDTIMEVLNYDHKNTITFYAWPDRSCFKVMSDTIGVWKIKQLKN